jgi:hypothetical protein
MDPITLTAVATAIATVLAKPLEKISENIGDVIWAEGGKLINKLREKNQTPLLVSNPALKGLGL